MELAGEVTHDGIERSTLGLVCPVGWTGGDDGADAPTTDDETVALQLAVRAGDGAGGEAEVVGSWAMVGRRAPSASTPESIMRAICTRSCSYRGVGDDVSTSTIMPASSTVAEPARSIGRRRHARPDATRQRPTQR